ncbi:GPI mannosyltransferase/alpha 1,2-mannosyltransferase [Blumeria hordei DH14]|uniref:Mannosyltransferase n=1 Tax=Blumeria graminis f. sp. hordei (strain DH14) TaxID=546991 RepID=N1JAS7_BLUG1|nr:GPI mannosyltransferase/alpha 1,2-mannosyltransferase [Blumeria hordei DH14]
MWRRTYILLVLIRLYFALSPSYLHPDENFQGPEVIAVFSYPIRLTWEFTSTNPVRSVFPLWPVYGFPMLLLRWLWMGNKNNNHVPPIAAFWTLRVLMFVLSFVLEDWALHELIQIPKHRKVAVMLVASSYVTWTYQTHTFSNSIETLAVAWSLVLIQRIVENKKRSSCFASAILAFVAVFGIFNRITFPAFLLIPSLRLVPHFINKPSAFLTIIISTIIFTFIAITVDTNFYSEKNITWSHLLSHPFVTPINNLKYNLSPKNLAQHGLHPWYQHGAFNLPLLVGPIIFLLLRPKFNMRLYSAMSGIFVLSLFQHQEARFLLPAVPLILSSVKLPKNQIILKLWASAWIIFNVLLGVLMGVYHQGGVVPTQVFLSKQPDATHAVWWKTYSPPIWLLDGKNEVLKTHEKMGMDGDVMLRDLRALATCRENLNSTNPTPKKEGVYLVAPLSALFLEDYIAKQESEYLYFQEVWHYKRHLNLDDLDFDSDGLWPTIKRVVGRRGISAWKVTTDCNESIKK